MGVEDALREWGRPVLVACGYAVGLVAALHALTRKRDPRATLGWVVVALGFPGIGALLYLLFGINRIHTRAKEWQSLNRWLHPAIAVPDPKPILLAPQSADPSTFQAFTHAADRVTEFPLVSGCQVEVLHNGEAAYPAMLAAIDRAERFVYLSSYIFDRDVTGRAFADALAKAKGRGVEVKVLVDGFGVLYSFPPIDRLLARLGVPVARFLPFSLSKRSVHVNLRNHRKILLVDGREGFTGGMNIGDRHLVDTGKRRRPVVDMQFAVKGPVLSHFETVFLRDWYFATGEMIPLSTGTPAAAGTALCRGIGDGPNVSFEKLRLIFQEVFASSKRTIRIMMPYFVPDSAMIAFINTAALRGVAVEIILPKKSNLPYVDWASRALLWEMLQYGVRIFLQPAPFAHSKFLVADDFFSLIGSANMDARSLRLNFEFNMEVYDTAFANTLAAHFDSARERSEELHLKTVDGRPFPIKMRDSFAKLFSPYL